jgi:intracellular sulfur oxidation DsrE/DsrF family protein
MKKILLILAMMLTTLFSETEFAEPKPSIMNLRQIVIPMSSGDTKEMNRVISAVNNMMKFYGPEKVEFVIVAYGQGLKSLLKNGDKDTRIRIEALMTYPVEFVACGNTMRTLKITKKDLLDDIEFATAGLVEIVERQLQGYTYIYP